MRQRRYVPKLVLFLVLGVIANVMMTTACAFVAQRHFLLDARRRYLYANVAQEDFGIFDQALFIRSLPKPSEEDKAKYPWVFAVPTRTYNIERFAYRESRVSDPFIDASIDATREDSRNIVPVCTRTVHIEAGRPFRSLWVQREYLVNVDHERRELERGHFPETCYVHALPYKPLLGGFALDTLLYSAGLGLMYLIVTTPRRLRRQNRAKRGLCPACAYPLGTNAVCTECGRDLSDVLGRTGCPPARR